MVTAPTEPLTLKEIATDEQVEAIRFGLAGTSDLATAVRLADGRWHTVNLDDSEAWDTHTLEELDQIAIPGMAAPLVPRDDAAELRAAVKAYFEAQEHYRDATYTPDELPMRGYFVAAEESLRAALAATEGKP